MSLMLSTVVPYDTANYDALLNSWSQIQLQDSVTLNVNGNYTLTNSTTARDSIITNFLWTINDNGGI